MVRLLEFHKFLRYFQKLFSFLNLLDFSKFVIRKTKTNYECADFEHDSCL